jgi:hypothetical protein
MKRALVPLILVVIPFVVRAAEAPKPAPPKPAPPKTAGVVHQVGVNLVVNPNFAKPYGRGQKRPLGWEEPDGLTSFWESVGQGHARVIRLDTDVLQSEHDKRLKEMTLPTDKRPPPKPKSPTVPPKYDTVGGNKGATLRSDPILLEQGAAYRITVDVLSRGPAAKIWVKGYGIIPKRGNLPERRRKLYDAYKQVRGKTEGWETFTRVVHPTNRPSNLRGSNLVVREIQVQLYAYWPAGEVLFDNVRFEKIIEEKDAEKDRREDKPKSDR